MNHEETHMQRQKHERIARVKRILRMMPRRATVHRFPVLKWFARAARRRSFLWCFRVKTVVPALYAGCILSLLPLYGIQLPLAVALSFLLRANLPVLTTLQFITNPLTVLPIYYSAYQVGRIILNLFGLESPGLNMTEMNALIESIKAGELGYNIHYLAKTWSITTLGSCVLGISLGAIGSAFYRLAAHEVDIFNKRLKDLQLKKTEAHNENPRTPKTVPQTKNPHA